METGKKPRNERLPIDEASASSNTESQENNKGNKATLRLETFSPEIHAVLKELETSGVDALEALSDAKTEEELRDSLLGLASVRAGLEDVRRNAISDIEGDSKAFLESASIISKTYEMDARFNPKLLPEFSNTPDEGIKALRALYKDQQSGAYGKLIAEGGIKIGKRTEDIVRRLTERMLGFLPSKEKRDISAMAGKLSGRLAMGLTFFGVGLLALGSRTTAEAEILLHDEGNGVIALENDVNQERIVMVPFNNINTNVTDPEGNALFEILANSEEITADGVNYDIVDPAGFEAVITEDGKTLSEELFSKELESLTPVEFIKLINAMVQRRLEYNHLSVKEDDEGNLVLEAKIENEAISAMPLDVMYMEYGKGVCRHYAALVEKIGDILKSSVPSAKGIAVEEVVVIDQLHAWNMYYLAEKGASNEVVVTFTDATFDDNTEELFDKLPAEGRSHANIWSLVNESLDFIDFTRDEKIKIFQNLASENMASTESRFANRELSQLLFEKHLDVILSKEESATEKGEGHEYDKFESLELIRKHAMMADLYGEEYNSKTALYIFQMATEYLVRHYVDERDPTDAIDEVVISMSVAEASGSRGRYSGRASFLILHTKVVEDPDVMLDSDKWLELFDVATRHFESEENSNIAHVAYVDRIRYFTVTNNEVEASKALVALEDFAKRIGHDSLALPGYVVLVEKAINDGNMDEAKNMIARAEKLLNYPAELPDPLYLEVKNAEFKLDELRNALHQGDISASSD